MVVVSGNIIGADGLIRVRLRSPGTAVALPDGGVVLSGEAEADVRKSPAVLDLINGGLLVVVGRSISGSDGIDRDVVVAEVAKDVVVAEAAKKDGNKRGKVTGG